ncbi:MAG: hypothetical protein CL938_02540 [Deltaproteobacteria bacterium]|jgi:hypothetical protein|nr:hypothetical protein [Deltaproteobacteria bacterium]
MRCSKPGEAAAMSLRASAVGVALAGLLGLPVLLLAGAAPGFEALALQVAGGFAAAVDAVGWVFIPQFALAAAILSLALQRLVTRAAGAVLEPPPAWLDPAVESALLLGLLGTISGMVRGFVGVSPEELEPGPLVYALGAALRSSFVGFAIALVGVWVRARPA